MTLALVIFFTTDVLISLGMRRYLMKKDPLLIGVIASYIYTTIFCALYLYMARYKKLLFTLDISEMYSTFLPGSLFFCFFMFLFHCWAFATGLKTYPGKYKDIG